MKKTIRYMFVSHGAIGEGRGQGLKSLGEKEGLPFNSNLSYRSSDIVKKYIKSIETSKIFCIFFNLRDLI